MMSRLRVAVIGSGAAGLAALRHLTANPQKYSPTAFEMTSDVSGTWVYTEKVGQDDRGLPIHSSMYRNLRTNLPKEVMAFPDFPFRADLLRSFITHEEVRQYLEDYTAHYDLRKHIQFNSRVSSVRPLTSDGDATLWSVEVTDVTCPQRTSQTHEFDAVMICNGHYAKPLMPDLPGLASFQGLVMHSHNYRSPVAFKGRTVVVLGAGSSGQDISLDIAAEAKHVYLCHRKPPLETPLPDNVSQAAAIREVRQTSVLLEDDSELTADGILLCTGYHYDFSFLSETCQVRVSKEERVWPLYKHVINARHPSMCFIGLTKYNCPFPQFDCQVRFFLAALSGELALPSSSDMEADIERDFTWRLGQGMPERYAHKMGPLQWPYNDELSVLAGGQPIPPVVRTLYDHVHNIRVQNLAEYKAHNYRLVDEKEFKVAD